MADEVPKKPPVVSPEKVQKLLLMISNRIQKEYQDSSYFTGDNGDKNLYKNLVIAACGKDGKNPSTINPQEASQVLFLQQQFFSGLPITHPEFAKAIFAAGHNTSSINNNRPGLQYVIENKIIFQIYDEFYYFNIDSANQDASLFKKSNSLNNLNDVTYEPSFFINKLDIETTTRDTINIRPSFLLNFNIQFSELDSLIEPIIIATSVSDSKKTIKIPLLGLIYKDFLNAAFDQDIFVSNNPSKTDHNGLFLQQTLRFINNGDNKQFIEKLNSSIGSTEFSKVYHLYHLKHTYDMYKKNEAIGIPLENSLKVEYTAQESDGEEKSYSSIETPTSLNNMFNLLNYEQTTKKILERNGDDFKVVRDFRLKQQKYKKALHNLKVKFEETQKAGQLSSQQQKQLSDEQKKEAEKVNKLQNFINSLLAEAIIDNVKIYQISVPYELLGVYSSEVPEETWLEWVNRNLSEIISIITGVVDITYGVSKIAGSGVLEVFSGGAATPIAVAGAAWGAANIGTGAYNIYEAIQRIRENSENRAKEFLNKVQETKLNPDIENKLPQQINFIRVDENNLLAKSNNLEEARTKLKELSEVRLRTITSDAQMGKNVDLKFVLFKDIINFIDLTCLPSDNNPSPKHLAENPLVLSLNYIREKKDITSEYYPINFAYMPIYLNSLSNFLVEYIINKNIQDFSYSTDTFILNVFEALIKNSLNDIYFITKNKTLPEAIKFSNSTHDISNNNKRFAYNKKFINMLENKNNKTSDITEESNKFIITQNMKLIDNEGFKLQKIITIGAVQDLQNYDYYGDFNKKEQYFNTKEISKAYNFQNYIMNDHKIPCIVLERIKRYNNILKTKHVNFSRDDNFNMLITNTGNSMIWERLPYVFDAELHSYLWFFINLASSIFVVPPDMKYMDSLQNWFNFGGVYSVLDISQEYYFQNISNSEETLLSNEKSGCKIKCRQIHTGTNTIAAIPALNK